MNNFFCNHKTQKSDPEHTFSEIDINYRRDYSKGKSFKVSIWNEIDTYNNDDFIQDFVIYNQSLWARIDSTPSTNEVPTEGPWTKVMDGVSDVQFKEEGNKIFWKYEDESEWKDLFELDVVSESEIRNMLKDIATDVDSNFYDKTLSETSVNAVQNKVITQALNKKADKTELSKKQDVISDLSEIRNKAKSALQSVPSEYVTKSELANKGYLTEHQDISGKQDKIADLAQIRANAQKGATALQSVPEKYATKTDVSNEVAKIVNSAPKAFDTLKEIADWIEEDDELATVLANKIEQKVDKEEGKGLSTNDYTNEDKEKLNSLENYDDSELWHFVWDLDNQVSARREEILYLQNSKADKSELTELSAEVSGLSERIDNLPSGESSVFEAIYGETTFNEIVEQYNANKHVIVKYGEEFLSLAKITKNSIDFTSIVNNSSIRVTCGSSNAWNPYSYTLEWTRDKVKTINAESTDTQYPSAKAVYEALQNVGGGSDVFVAEYGKTTYAEIVTAYEENRIIYLNKDNMQYVLQFIVPTAIYFVSTYQKFHYQVACTEKDTWYSQRIDLYNLIEDVDNGNIKVTIDSKTREVASGTPSGDPMHYMFEAAGATYNATDADIPMVGIYGDSYVHKARHWHLNELGDITNEEMRAIYRFPMPIGGLRYSVRDGYAPIRTLIGNPFESASNPLKLYSCFVDSAIETVRLGFAYATVNEWQYTFDRCPKLTKVLDNYIDCNSLSTYQRNFRNCSLLRDIRLKKVKCAMSFEWQPNLSNASILYIIQNEVATSAIVITLHADAYARAMADTEIQSALEAHPNVSLASA